MVDVHDNILQLFCFLLFILYHETTRFSRVGGGLGASSHTHLIHKTMRFSRGGCTGYYLKTFLFFTIQFLPRDDEIFSWGVCVTIFLIFTTRPRDYLVVDVHDNILFLTLRPRDFLVVVVCDNIFNIHHETTRFSRGGCG